MPGAALRSNEKRIHKGACHATARRRSARRRVLCFECYRARFDRPERRRIRMIPFLRMLTAPEREHRGRMLAHLARADKCVEGTDRSARAFPTTVTHGVC
jgi:hypothetical protein